MNSLRSYSFVHLLSLFSIVIDDEAQICNGDRTDDEEELTFPCPASLPSKSKQNRTPRNNRAPAIPKYRVSSQ
jgi:hypothetical protein